MFDILMIQDTYLWAYQKPFLQHRLMFWWTQCRKIKAQEKKKMNSQSYIVNSRSSRTESRSLILSPVFFPILYVA